MKPVFLLSLLSLFILAGCSMPGAAMPTATLDQDYVATTAAGMVSAKLTELAGTQTPTLAVPPTDTPSPQPPTAIPTVEVKLEPVDALCTSNATVRSWPGKGGDNLGGVFFGKTVQALARNDIGNWLYILWPDSPSGHGWVNARGFELKGDVTRLPIGIQAADGSFSFVPAVVWTAVTPQPMPTLSNDPKLRSATVIGLANLRVCPSTSCQIIGSLEPGIQVILTGRIGENAWGQIIYPGGPQDRAWISRDVIQLGSEAFGGLPYFDLLGRLITPEPPTATSDPNISPTPTSSSTPAPVGALAELTNETVVYELQSSLSPEIGRLKARDKIYITAQSLNGLWYEIQYPANSNSRAYISSKYVHLLGDFRYVTYTDDRGTPIPTP